MSPKIDDGLEEEQENIEGRVIVVGAAVMDATFRTKSIPPRETSAEAHSFTLAPGGKGLMQAVAAARLGLNVSLVAAVTTDQFGQQIVRFLEEEGVDTSLLKRVDASQTPFTAVIEFELGDSIALNWRNKYEVHLDVQDIEQRESSLLASDIVLITFEVPPATLQHCLTVLHNISTRRPIVIVTPGNPYLDSEREPQALAGVNYLVAHPWELGPYATLDQSPFDLESVVRRLLDYGVETVCVPMGAGCTVYSETELGTFMVPAFPSPYVEQSASRDAFCAALAAQLIENNGKFSERVALWATAARAAAQTDFPISNSMPNRRRVEEMLNRSRFTLALRGDVSDAT